jgi:hypothetical protein
VETSLTHLIHKQLARRLAAPERDLAMYALAHDYLVRAIVELQRERNRWQRLVSDSYQTFLDSSGDLWRQYKALLPPRRSANLMLRRVLGDFRYGEARGYAALSTIKLIPAALILAAVSVGGLLFRDAQREQRAEILQLAAGDALNRAGRLGESITDREKEGLWEIASQDSAEDALELKVVFLQAVMSSPDLAAKFVDRHAQFTAALWGTDAALADYLCSRACWPEPSQAGEDSILLAQSLIGIDLPSFNPMLLGSVLTNVRFHTSEDGKHLAETAAIFARRADSQYASMAFFRMLPAARNAGGGTVSYARVLSALAERLDNDAAQHAVEEVSQWKTALRLTGLEAPGSPASEEGDAVRLVLLTLGRAQRAQVSSLMTELFPDPQPPSDGSRWAWHSRPLVYAVVGDVLKVISPAERGALVARITAYGSTGSWLLSTSTRLDDAFFAFLSRVAVGLEAPDADAALKLCQKYSKSMFVGGQITPMRACELALSPSLSATTAGELAKRELDQYDYGELPLTATRVSSKTAVELLRGRLTETYTSNLDVGLIALALQVTADDARTLLASQVPQLLATLQSDPHGVVKMFPTQDGDAARMLAVLTAKAMNQGRAGLASDLVESMSRDAFRLDRALALAGLADSVEDATVPGAFTALSRLVLDNYLRQAAQPVQPVNAPPLQASDRLKVTYLVPGLQILAHRLGDAKADEALESWMAALQNASPEDVSAFGPVVTALARLRQQDAFFDLLKRPDYRAMPQVRAVLGASLERIWQLSSSGFWAIVAEAGKRGLNVKTAPSEDLGHYLRGR